MNHHVMTLTEAQRNYLRAAIRCLLAAQAAYKQTTDEFFCLGLCDEANDVATAYGTISPLDHQDGAELSELLGIGTLELRVPADAGGITPYFDDEPSSYTDQVGVDEEAFRVPVMLTVGAETAAEAGTKAIEFLDRATADEAVNFDEVVQAFDVGYEAAMLPAEVLRDLALGDSYMG